MEVKLHPEAVRRFSEQAEKVRCSLGLAPPAMSSPPVRGSLAHTFVERDIILGVDTGDSPWVEGLVDPITNRYVSLEIHSPRFHLALSSEGMRTFGRLADQVARHKDLRDLCALKYIELSLIEWLEDAQVNGPSRPWSDVLVEALHRDVKPWRLLVPLEGIAIEEPFSVGSVGFGFFTREYFERVYTRAQSKGISADDLAALRRKYDSYQGVVYASFECTAEPQRAKERALDEVEKVLALMRFFHGAALDVRLHCPLGRMGGLIPHQAHFFLEADGELRRTFHELSRWGHDLSLSRVELRQAMNDGLAKVEQLLRATDRNDLQTRVLDAMALFSGGLLFPGIEHRLIHALVAVESLLLKSPNEPIVGSLVPRLAHVAGSTIEQRREIVSDLRDVYEVRSSYVHHGKQPRPESIEMVNRAVKHCWVAILTLLGEVRWTTKDDVIRALDDRLLM